MTREELIISEFESDLQLRSVLSKYKADYATVRRLWLSKYSISEYKNRISRLNRLAKTGSKNPMFGKFGDKHHSYVPVQHTISGYCRVHVPSWYTGPNKSGRVSEHIVKYCEYHGLTEIPQATVVHHINENKKDNSKDNLVLMSIGQHMKHHGLEKARKAQRLAERRRAKDSSKRGEPNNGL